MLRASGALTCLCYRCADSPDVPIQFPAGHGTLRLSCQPTFDGVKKALLTSSLWSPINAGPFADPTSRDLLRAAIQSVRERHPFDILAFVLLPDHLHCIWTLPENDDDFPKRWQQIKGRFSHDYMSAGGRDRATTVQHHQQKRRGIWQPRYWEHRLRDEADYFRHRDYIHLNPVKHGYVENPGEWPGSNPVDLPDVDE